MVERNSLYFIYFVALHQVFRFNIMNSTRKADLTLGVAFKPGRLSNQFCKPTSVASLENGDFFVADGYCNSRIIKYNFSGIKLMEWGKNSFQGFNINPTGAELPNNFAVPHALTLVPEKDLLCVADRENGRVQWYNFFNTGRKHNSNFYVFLFAVFTLAMESFTLNTTVQLLEKEYSGEQNLVFELVSFNVK